MKQHAHLQTGGVRKAWSVNAIEYPSRDAGSDGKSSLAGDTNADSGSILVFGPVGACGLTLRVVW
jgi:hypothetical protein